VRDAEKRALLTAASNNAPSSELEAARLGRFVYGGHSTLCPDLEHGINNLGGQA